MDGRARKRTESDDQQQLVPDKRACSSSGIRPGATVPDEPPDAQKAAGPSSSDHHAADHYMESSSASSSSVRPESGSVDESSCSDGGEEEEGDDPDPDPDPRDDGGHHDGGRGGDRVYGCSLSREKSKSVLSSLDEEAGASAQLAALTELCEMLSFGSEDSLAGLAADSFARVLVRLAGNESNPEIMLLAIRALAYLCDVLPRSATAIVKHGALPVLCGRLMSIDYLDVAEQGIQALEKISHNQPVPCLRAGAIMAVLTYIDFFTASIQRVALSTVANMCKKFSSDCSSHVLEAIPTLCNLLHYDDGKIVETAAICLKRISENITSSPDLLDDMCKHGLVNQCASLIASASGGRPSLSQETYVDLIRLLSRLASGSLVAFKALLEMNISSTLRGILETADVSHNVSHSFRSNAHGHGHANQVHEVLKLLAHLLPFGSSEDKDIQLVLAKEKILVQEEFKFLRQLGKDILPVLIQVVNSGASTTICYGCISLIHSLVYLSSSEMLLDLFRDINLSSFLAGLLSRKDIHVLNSSLKTARILLEKHSDVFMGPFVKEGVVYAVDSLQVPDNRAQFMAHSPIADSGQVTTKDISKCFCHVFNPCYSMSRQVETCKLEKETVLALAKQIRTTYFNTFAKDSDKGLTDVLQKLKSFCGTLNDNVEKFSKVDCSQNEEYLAHILKQIMKELHEGEPLSTFEFIESRIARSLAYYLSNGMYLQGLESDTDSQNRFFIILERLQTFASICLSKSGQNQDSMLLTIVRRLQNALASFDQFPVVSSLGYKHRNVYADIPFGRSTMHPCLKVCFVPEDESMLDGYSENVFTIESSSSLDAIEEFLWSKISTKNEEESAEDGNKGCVLGGKCDEGSVTCEKHGKFIDEHQSLASSLLEVSINQELHLPSAADASMTNGELMSRNGTCSDPTGRKETRSISHVSIYASPKLTFYLEGKQLDRSLTLYQALLHQDLDAEPDMVIEPKFWNNVYKVTYKTTEHNESNCRPSPTAFNAAFPYKTSLSFPELPFFSCILDAKLPCTLEKSKPSYDVLFMLKVLEGLNRVGYKLLSYERNNAFAEGRISDFDDLKLTMSAIPQLEFLSSKLTEKLEQQMRDPLSFSTGSMPPWCSQLMAACPFLFSFEARWKYVCLTVFSSSRVQQKPLSQRDNSGHAINFADNQWSHAGNFARKRFQVDRSHVLESATRVMSSHTCKEAILEVEFFEEVGIGLGPTLEFYTLVSHEFQKIGLGMWRGDNSSTISVEAGNSEYVLAPLGLFPRPWSAATISSNGIQFTNVRQQFVLLGQIVAKALQDGRILDLPLSKAFYKLMLEQELDVYDIQSFDPELGMTLLEFQALVCRRRYLESTSGKNETGNVSGLSYRGTRIEDLCLDFTLPGHSDYLFSSGNSSNMVDIINLEEYVSLVVDATIGSGLSRQIEAFKSGFNEVFPLKALQIFTEDELEHLLCGEQNSWMFDELLDHINFDHGYTATSPPVISLLETVQEFECNQRRAFLQFVTGAPRLPPGGFAALNPKLTVVRKHCSDCADMELPSVMTCANYLKLPPYTSKETLRERLLYAITEGQGSFHLS